MHLDYDGHSDKDRTHQVSGYTFIFRGIFFASSSDVQGAVRQHGNSVIPGDGVPLAGPCDGWLRFTGCLTVQYDSATGIHNSFQGFKSDNGRTLQSQAHAALHHPGLVGSHTRVVASIFIHSAIDGQGAITQLLDPVVSFYVGPLSAPLDGWGRVSSHLAV